MNTPPANGGGGPVDCANLIQSTDQTGHMVYIVNQFICMPVFCPQDFPGLHVQDARAMKTAAQFPLVVIGQLQAGQPCGTSQPDRGCNSVADEKSRKSPVLTVVNSKTTGGRSPDRMIDSGEIGRDERI
jgi:hypothetical protein